MLMHHVMLRAGHVDGDYGPHGILPIMDASGHGRVAAARLLVALDSECLQLCDDCGQSPLMYAASCNDVEVVKIVHRGYPDALHHRYQLPFCYAIRSGSIDAVKYFITQEPTALQDRGRWVNDILPLQLAVRFQGEHMVRELLTVNPAIAQWGNEHGETAFHEAARSGKAEKHVVMPLLVDAFPSGASQEGRNGWTPLHYAASAGSESVMRILLQADASAANKKTTDTQQTPSDIAKARGNFGCVRLLQPYQQSRCAAS